MITSEREGEFKSDDEDVSELAKRLAPQPSVPHKNQSYVLRASRPHSFLFFFLLVIAFIPSAGLAVVMFTSPTLKQSLMTESRTVLSLLPPVFEFKAHEQPKPEHKRGAVSNISGPQKDFAKSSAPSWNQQALARPAPGRSPTVETPLAVEDDPPESTGAVTVTSVALEQGGLRDKMVSAPKEVETLSFASAPSPSGEQPQGEGENAALSDDAVSVAEVGALPTESGAVDGAEPVNQDLTGGPAPPLLSGESQAGPSISAQRHDGDEGSATRSDSPIQHDEDLVLRPDEIERIHSLMAHGHKMIDVGYFAGARAYFQRAAEAGSGEAALALGLTYDPEFIDEMGAHGIEPQLDQARFWYERAQRLKTPGAEAKLARLARRFQVDANAVSPAMSGETEGAVASPHGNEDPPGARPSESLAEPKTWVEPRGAVNLRNGPTPHSEAKQVITRGTKLLVMASKANWFRVTDPKTGDIGWIYSKAVETASPAQLGSAEANGVRSR